MTHLKSSFRFLCMALMFVILIAFSAFAEEIIPEKDAPPVLETEATPVPVPTPLAVNDLKVTLDGTKATLTWTKVANAESYKIYLVNKDTKTIKELIKQNVTATSYKVTGLKKALTYSFMIQGISKEGIAGPAGNVKSVTVPAPKPDAPKDFNYFYKDSTSVRFEWSKVSGADGYKIFIKKDGEKEFTSLKKYSKSTTSCKISDLPTDTTYYFRIKSYHKVNGVKVYSNPSKTVKVKLDYKKSELSKVHAPRYHVIATRDIVGKDKLTGKTVVIKKSTKFTVNSKARNDIVAYLSNGRQIKLKRSGITYRGLDCTTKNDYSKTLKELFLNTKKYSSSTGWFIWVSEYKLKTNIFQGSQGKWKLVKEFPCVVGSYSNRTTSGLHNILRKVYSGKYGSPMFWFTVGPEGTKSNPSGCAFHQYVDSTRNAAASHGCIRLDTSALYFMYNRIPTGTPVLIH